MNIITVNTLRSFAVQITAFKSTAVQTSTCEFPAIQNVSRVARAIRIPTELGPCITKPIFSERSPQPRFHYVSIETTFSDSFPIYSVSWLKVYWLKTYRWNLSHRFFRLICIPCKTEICFFNSHNCTDLLCRRLPSADLKAQIPKTTVVPWAPAPNTPNLKFTA